MSNDLKTFCMFQVFIIFLVLAVMDCIIRGPMIMQQKQLSEIAYLLRSEMRTTDLIHEQRIDLLSKVLEQGAK